MTSTTPAPDAETMTPSSPMSRPNPPGGLRPALTPAAVGTQRQLSGAVSKEDQHIKIHLTEVSTLRGDCHAVHVRDRGLDASPDPEVAALAAHEGRVLVTENVKDFAHTDGITIVCILKSRLRARGMDQHLATILDTWAHANPHPYRGLHWPAPTPAKRR